MLNTLSVTPGPLLIKAEHFVSWGARKTYANVCFDHENNFTVHHCVTQIFRIENMKSYCDSESSFILSLCVGRRCQEVSMVLTACWCLCWWGCSAQLETGTGGCCYRSAWGRLHGETHGHNGVGCFAGTSVILSNWPMLLVSHYTTETVRLY